MYFDTHAHLSVKQFEDDLETVIQKAYDNKVFNILLIGMDETQNKRCITIAHQHDGLYAAVGIHPSDVEVSDVSTIIPLLKDKKVVAIGEIGIDLYWRQDNLDKQKEVFIAQLELAVQYNLPVVIHTRNSFDIVYELIKPYKGKIKGVFHCLTSSHADAVKVMQLGFYVGIGGVVTYPKATIVHEIAKNIPIERILIETDAPYLSPHPYRSKRNEPALVTLVAQQIADIKEMPVEMVARITTQNAINLFGINQQKNLN